jgi:hypothetical protein
MALLWHCSLLHLLASLKTAELARLFTRKSAFIFLGCQTQRIIAALMSTPHLSRTCFKQAASVEQQMLTENSQLFAHDNNSHARKEKEHDKLVVQGCRKHLVEIIHSICLK